jgi:DNA-binding transcriptional MerR regulator
VNIRPAVTVPARSAVSGTRDGGIDEPAGRLVRVPAEEAVEPVDEPRLTVAAAARRLGIAPATLRTWDRRYGIGPSDHAPGRHRRYSPDDLARLELMQHALVRGATPADAARYAQAARLPRPGAGPADRLQAVPGIPADQAAEAGEEASPGGEVPPEGADGTVEEIGEPLLLADVEAGGELAARVRVGGRVLRLPGAGRRARGLGRAALAMDAAAVRRLLADSIEADGVVRTWNEVARPVLTAVAERWASTGAGVEIEHLVSECVIGVLGANATAAPPARTPRPVLLAGMPGEHHALPMVVLSAVLAGERIGCRPLGADLPHDALVAAVRRIAPAAVVLWSQLPATADSDLVRDLPRTRPRFRTFVAGPGWDDAELPPRVTRLGTLEEACAAIRAAVT